MAKRYKKVDCPEVGHSILNFFCDGCKRFVDGECGFKDSEIAEIKVEGFGKVKVRRKKIWIPKGGGKNAKKV